MTSVGSSRRCLRTASVYTGDRVRECLFGQVGIAGIDMHDPESRLDGDLAHEIVSPAADEHRAVDAGLGQ